MTNETRYATFDELPEFVHAADEDLYLDVCYMVCDQHNLDRRFAEGNIQDEYHAVPLDENYDDIPDPEGDPKTNPDYDLIPKQSMIDFATSDVLYYATHDPEYHVDGDVTKPSIVTHETWGDEIECTRCELDAQFAFEDELIAMGPERITRIRAYVDTVIPDDLKPYDVRQSANNVHYYRLFHNEREIGSAQFNDSVDQISIPLVHTTDDRLFLNAHPEYEIREGRVQRKA